MRLLFVGGPVDNTEIAYDGGEPPAHYPPDTGSGHSRYRLHLVGRTEGAPVYAVYGAPDLAASEVNGTSAERDYARRFGADEERAPA
ncbi:MULTISPECIES: hypothetical protein [unclassified Luteimonas]|uniref:hypothetical protein n=1 Tax=unclassified Luteimonas TaxID=2629088 RepID=UPI001601F6B9|nr:MULTISPECIES: hypothetical protein [unclassified Luteimonas]MBB1473009.1 hypothetical protein [Luteimonas sp. MC1782]MBB6598290.1 hypothetical protein [Luteimonas sp. MC1825]QOC88503.1 hypothetical protein IDM46_01675 [Luteimonas sp. MC1825]